MISSVEHIRCCFLFIFLFFVSFFFFFFSSRRRHTRWNCDWSSDVCSSDLLVNAPAISPRSGSGGRIGCIEPSGSYSCIDSASPHSRCSCSWSRARMSEALRGRRPLEAQRLRRLRRSEEHTSELQSQFHLVC